MKKILPIYFIAIIAFLFTNSSHAQGVAINTDGSTADASAVLDVKSTGKGVLVPRMALSDRTLITSPATGLLIYQTDNTPGFYYNAGTPGTPNWTLLGATGAAGPTGPNGPPGAGFVNGSSAGQVYLTGVSPFSPQAPQTVTGDVTINSIAVTSYNNIVPANKGGAGAINGILQANGAGTVSAASTVGGGSVVLANSPILVTPALGTPSALVGTNITGTAANLTAGTVTTNANLTGDVKSTGNATSYNNVVPANKGGAGAINGILQANGAGTVSAASTTGAGNVVLATSPTMVTPNLGTIASGDGTSLTNLQNIANNSTAGNSIEAALNNGGTAGTIAVARLGTGATATNFLRGDGTFATPAGGSSTTALTFISSLLNLALASSPTLYFNPNGGSVVGTHTGVTYTGANDFADVDNMIIPFACTISSLTVTSNTILTGTGPDNTTFTVYKNGAAQGMGCLVTNTTTVGNISSMTDNTHTFNVVAGDRISISFKESNINGTSAPYISYGVVLRTQ